MGRQVLPQELPVSSASPMQPMVSGGLIPTESCWGQPHRQYD